MTPMVPIAMFGWIPIVLQLFKRLRPHHAVIGGFLLSWMFLPQYAYNLPGLPDYTKVSAASYGVLLATAIFNGEAFSRYRFHPLDLPVLLWCISSFISSLTNGLGPWDGLSGFLGKVTTYGIPYYIGRLYFDRTDTLRDLCLGVFLGALIYVPFCWFELVMSPRLHKMVYGWHPHNFGQTKRGGGWRPVVFMQHGLMTSMWMISGTLAGCRLLWSGNLGKRLPVVPIASGLAVIVVAITTLLCKSMGATVLLVAGLAAIAVVTRTRRIWPVLLIAFIPVAYMATRGTGVWDAEGLLQVIEKTSSEERTGSLSFRIRNENVLAEKARQRVMFGWGGWKRSYIFDEEGRPKSVPDGCWIIAFGQNGLFGLSALTLTIMVPQLLFLRRYPVARWREPAVAAVAPLSMLLGLFMIDNLLNDMFNPVMLLAAGGLTGLALNREETVTLEEGAVALAPEALPAAGPRLL